MCVRLWFLNSSRRAHVYPQPGTTHANGFKLFRSVCNVSLCRVRWPRRAQLKPQPGSPQANGFAPPCVSLCAVRWCRHANLEMHPGSSQACGFSPVCIRLCRLKLLGSAHTKPHPGSLQACGLPYDFVRAVSVDHCAIQTRLNCDGCIRCDVQSSMEGRDSCLVLRPSVGASEQQHAHAVAQARVAGMVQQRPAVTVAHAQPTASIETHSLAYLFDEQRVGCSRCRSSRVDSAGDVGARGVCSSHARARQDVRLAQGARRRALRLALRLAPLLTANLAHPAVTACRQHHARGRIRADEALAVVWLGLRRRRRRAWPLLLHARASRIASRRDCSSRQSEWPGHVGRHVSRPLAATRPATRSGEARATRDVEISLFGDLSLNLAARAAAQARLLGMPKNKGAWRVRCSHGVSRRAPAARQSRADVPASCHRAQARAVRTGAAARTRTTRSASWSSRRTARVRHAAAPAVPRLQPRLCSRDAPCRALAPQQPPRCDGGSCELRHVAARAHRRAAWLHRAHAAAASVRSRCC